MIFDMHKVGSSFEDCLQAVMQQSQSAQANATAGGTK
jgi:hypothetical protein